MLPYKALVTGNRRYKESRAPAFFDQLHALCGEYGLQRR